MNKNEGMGIVVIIALAVVIAFIAMNNMKGGTIGTVVAPEGNKDIVFVVDTSGSMFGSRLGNVTLALSSVLDTFYSPTIKAGLVTYGNYGNLQQPLTTDYSSIKTKLTSIVPIGNTNIEQGIYLAKQELLSNGRAGAQKIMYIITDGMPNMYSNPYIKCDELVPQNDNNCTIATATMAQAAKSAGITIYTYGIGIETATWQYNYLRNNIATSTSYADNRYNATASYIKYIINFNLNVGTVPVCTPNVVCTWGAYSNAANSCRTRTQSCVDANGCEATTSQTETKTCPCVDSTWTPDTSTVCSGDSFTQTSNCAKTRTMTGSKTCTAPCVDSTWSPDPSTKCVGLSFTQTSNCGNTRTLTGTKVETWTPDPSTVCSGDSVAQTSTCGNTRTLTGTKDCSTPCTDTSWTPLESTKCSGLTFVQTSNCGNTRTATGSKTETWSPALSEVCSGTTFQQTSTCDNVRTQVGTKDCSVPCTDTTWTPTASSFCTGISFTQTSNCGKTQSGVGTQACVDLSCSVASDCVGKEYTKPTCSGYEICTNSLCGWRCDSGEECNTLYWFDNTNKDCSSKQWCGAFMYEGLETFHTQDECKGALGGTCSEGFLKSIGEFTTLDKQMDISPCTIGIVVVIIGLVLVFALIMNLGK